MERLQELIFLGLLFLMCTKSGCKAAVTCESAGAQACISSMQTKLNEALKNMTVFCSIRDDTIATAQQCVSGKLLRCHNDTVDQVTATLNSHIDGYNNYDVDCIKVMEPCGPRDLHNREMQIIDCFLDVPQEGNQQENCRSLEEADECAHGFTRGCKESVSFYNGTLDRVQRSLKCGPYRVTTTSASPTGLSKDMACIRTAVSLCPTFKPKKRAELARQLGHMFTTGNVSNICRLQTLSDAKLLKCSLKTLQTRRCNMSDVGIELMTVISQCGQATTTESENPFNEEMNQSKSENKGVTLIHSSLQFYFLMLTYTILHIKPEYW